MHSWPAPLYFVLCTLYFYCKMNFFPKSVYWELKHKK